MNETLSAWNGLSPEAAQAAVLPCNGSLAWALSLALGRPFAGPEPLFAASDQTWRALAPSDWEQAFSSHPRIGETHAKQATAKSLAWSEGEQSGLSSEDRIRDALAEGNRAYEARFGRIFLVCATGKSAAEMLAILGRRLGNDPATELLEAAEAQRRITQLRLRKWLGVPPAGCDSV